MFIVQNQAVVNRADVSLLVQRKIPDDCTVVEVLLLLASRSRERNQRVCLYIFIKKMKVIVQIWALVYSQSSSLVIME